MRFLGLRELVALGVLIAALAIGFIFLDPAASEGTAAGTPITPPSSWNVTFFDARTEPATGDGSGDIPTLDLSFPGAPFANFRDDQWYVLAVADIQFAGGYSAITIQHTCDLEVVVDSHEVVRVPHNGKVQTSVAKFTHAAGPGRVVVQCRDSGGAFLLKYPG